MRLFHHWPDEEARKVKSLHGLQKTPFKSEVRRGNTGKTLPSKACPVFGCGSVVKNLSQHLKDVHKFDPRSNEYRLLLSRAVSMDLYKSKTGSISKSSNLPFEAPKDYLQFVLNNEPKMDESSSDSTYRECHSRSESISSVTSKADDDDKETTNNSACSLSSCDENTKSLSKSSDKNSDIDSSDNSSVDIIDKSSVDTGENNSVCSGNTSSYDLQSAYGSKVSYLESNRSTTNSKVQLNFDKFF